MYLVHLISLTLYNIAPTALPQRTSTPPFMDTSTHRPDISSTTKSIEYIILPNNIVYSLYSIHLYKIYDLIWRYSQICRLASTPSPSFLRRLSLSPTELTSRLWHDVYSTSAEPTRPEEINIKYNICTKTTIIL